MKMLVRAYDPINGNIIDFRAPKGAISQALSNYDGIEWEVSRSTYNRVLNFAHRLVVRTSRGPLQVMGWRYGDTFYLCLKP